MNRLIFDRTQADVDMDLPKGQYNASDLNRVETWCDFLATSLNSLGYSINITTKTNWVASDMRTASEMNRIQNNIKALMIGYRYISKLYATTDNWDWQKANRWEKILQEIYDMMRGMENYYVYSGVSNAGQQRFWQNRFRYIYGFGDLVWDDVQYVYWDDIPANYSWLDLVIE